MKKFRFLAYVVGFLGVSFALSSCLKDDNDTSWRPTALVTVRPTTGGSVILQLDNKTVLYPSNLKTSPFGNKEVRALVNYTEKESKGNAKTIYVNWIDSIRTKLPVVSKGAVANDTLYGKDPIEIIRDWVTVAEDGYLTLRIRTLWGAPRSRHYIHLLSGVNPSNPYEFELRHDAKGNTGGNMGDALIAFNLNPILQAAGQDSVKVKLNWKSFSGQKSAEFSLSQRVVTSLSLENSRAYNACVE